VAHRAGFGEDGPNCRFKSRALQGQGGIPSRTDELNATEQIETAKADPEFCNMEHGMKLLTRCFATALLVAGSLAAQQQFVGTWAGSTETVDDVNVHRYERHTIDLKMEGGKLVAAQLGRNGASSPMEVQVDGNKLNLYRFLPADGGEPLRWKLELKDGKLVGLYQCTHNNPAKWQYDRSGAITLAKEDAAAPAAK
jgi:hypothetical protein